MKTLPDPLEFVWDPGNSGKNEQKHRVSDQEAEEPFFDEKKQGNHDDAKHEDAYNLQG